MEYKFVIVRTRKNSTENCFTFMTPNYNKGNVLPTFVSNKVKIADEIDFKFFVGGMLSVVLTSHKSNGKNKYDVVEEVMFDKELVTGIEIYTEYASVRISD